MSKPMSEQMQKLADRYEKATGKKFDAQTNAQKIRAMNDEELADVLREFATKPMQGSFLKWLQQPAEEDEAK